MMLRVALPEGCARKKIKKKSRKKTGRRLDVREKTLW